MLSGPRRDDQKPNPRPYPSGVVAYGMAVLLAAGSLAADCQPPELYADPCAEPSPAQGDWTGFPASDHQCYQSVRSFISARFRYTDSFESERAVTIGDAAYGATDGGCDAAGMEGNCCDPGGACSAWTDDYDMNQYNCDAWKNDGNGLYCDEPAAVWQPRIDYSSSFVPQTYDVVVYPPTEDNGFGHIGFVDHAVMRNGRVVALWVKDSNYALDERAQYHCIAISEARPLGYYRLGNRATDTRTDAPLPEPPPWSQPPPAPGEAGEPGPPPSGAAGASGEGGAAGGPARNTDNLPTTCYALADVLGWRAVACEVDGNGECGGEGVATEDCDACCGSTCNFGDDASCGGGNVCSWDGMRYCCQAAGKTGRSCSSDQECSGPGQACVFNGEEFVCAAPECQDYALAVADRSALSDED